MDKLLTVKETAEYLKVTEITIRRWLEKGKLKGTKISRKAWRIREKDVELLVALMEVPREDFISQADLAKRFGVDRGTIRRRLKKCQDLGLVVVVKTGAKNQRKCTP